MSHTIHNRNQPGTHAQKIDIQKLAEKVYQLLLADLRQERARGAALSHRRKR